MRKKSVAFSSLSRNPQCYTNVSLMRKSYGIKENCPYFLGSLVFRCLIRYLFYVKMENNNLIFLNEGYEFLMGEVGECIVPLYRGNGNPQSVEPSHSTNRALALSPLSQESTRRCHMGGGQHYSSKALQH